ncbi:MAG: mechanosensitive ion channel [Chloroflexales bacterium]|nr:mechanosensitive ion channel [Chloroflexales bacterium]
MLEEVTRVLLAYIPNVIGAVLILLIGWIIAVLVAGLVERLLRRVRLDQRVGRALSDGGERAAPRTGHWIGRAVFWLIMLVAIIGALQALNLTLLIVPFNALLNDLFAFLPRLAAAAIVFMVAWLIATVLRFAVSRTLRALRFDERVAAEQQAQERIAHPGPPTGGASMDAPRAGAGSEPRSLADILATTAYWLVFFLFLPAMLGALGIQALLVPVQQVLTEVLLFLPNLLAAAIILVLGWFAARFTRRVTVMVAAGLGADRLSERVGLSRVLGQGGLSGLLGWVIYVLLLVPVAIGALNALGVPAITAPASAMLAIFLGAVPTIFAAAAIIGVSFVVGRVVARLVAELLARIGFNTWMQQLHIWTPPASAALDNSNATSGAELEPRTPADIVGTIILVGVILFATTAALNLLGLNLVAGLIAEFTVLAGRVILGLIIFGLGLVLASVAARAIVASKIARAGLLALTARGSILVLATAMALRQMGLANEIVNLAFGLLLGALAVAFALAFGLGGREPAQKEVERFFQGLRSPQIGGSAPTMETPKLDVRTRPAEGSND